MSIPVLSILSMSSSFSLSEALVVFIPAYLFYAHLADIGAQARTSYSGSSGTQSPPACRLTRRLALALCFAMANAVLWQLMPSAHGFFLFVLPPILVGSVVCDADLRWFIALSLTVTRLGMSERDVLGAGLPAFAIYYLLVEFGTIAGAYVRERKRCNLAELSR